MSNPDDSGFMKANGYLPIEDHGRNYVKPDWDKAREMVSHLEDPAPCVQGWDEAIGVYLEDGTKVFAMYADGTVECPDNSRLPEAAVIFFREVCKIATLQGYQVRKAPEPQPYQCAHDSDCACSQGWDS